MRGLTSSSDVLFRGGGHSPDGQSPELVASANSSSRSLSQLSWWTVVSRRDLKRVSNITSRGADSSEWWPTSWFCAAHRAPGGVGCELCKGI